MILNKFHHLMKKVDVNGWTALHYAAKFNQIETVNVLLSKDNSVGYVFASNDDALTALHIAIMHGQLRVAKEILSHCPDCWEMVTYKNENILHLAIENEQQEVLEFILDTSWASELINKKDEDGNTALHHYVGTKNLKGCNLVNHPWVDRSAFNKKGLTPLDIVTRETEQLTTRQSLKHELLTPSAGTNFWRVFPEQPDEASGVGERDNAQTFMVITTLILTVSFVAGFTIPGGYDSSKDNAGMAILGKRASFVAFVV
ncbi:OLC1v1000959C1 [Oldenlandia corymbosa var. corymbosa]|uniref:OLC1v1000959C1 n=1 Tax=Oldenlandia corymbosa var. corymbosa TaxID=529605 RepID=A0AAV1D486_OLDCO|nr:OLC1v1000959C1 [Oldenlandia corymbosa var. corymbosa]